MAHATDRIHPGDVGPLWWRTSYLWHSANRLGVNLLNDRQAKIDRIRRFPAELRNLLSGLTNEQLDAHYLEGEWSVAQNVHHLADSHMNAVARLRLILTRERPPLSAYNQDDWAELPDAKRAPIESSLLFLEGMHERWCDLWESLNDEQWQRVGMHEQAGEMTLDHILNVYSNHCDAHIDQICRTLAAGGILR
jgi:hypothetical protein